MPTSRKRNSKEQLDRETEPGGSRKKHEGAKALVDAIKIRRVSFRVKNFLKKAYLISKTSIFSGKIISGTPRSELFTVGCSWKKKGTGHSHLNHVGVAVGQGKAPIKGNEFILHVKKRDLKVRMFLCKLKAGLDVVQHTIFFSYTKSFSIP